MKDINLVPSYVLNERKHVILRQRMIIWGFVACLVIASVFVWLFVQKWLLASEVDAIQQKVNQLQSIKVEKDLISSLQQDINKKDEIIKAVDLKGAAILTLLQKLEAQMPKSIRNASVTYNQEDNTVSLTGTAANIYALMDLVNSINTSDCFEGAFIPSVTLGGQNTFTVTFKYVEGK
ncbi:MAG: PilN domain-containing protein [Ignavibacteriales bacterium]